MLSDIQIAQSTQLESIGTIAEKIGLTPDEIIPYGRGKAKLDTPRILKTRPQRGRLVLVTAMTPTPAGEGKTTVTVGLADALRRLDINSAAALREPSLGPVFGIKGGAAGGGYAQVVPMEDINLHFTGDIHAIGAANNLLAAMLDNHLQAGNSLNIDPRQIVWKRCLDMNDRQLRFLVSGLGGKTNGVPHEDGFDITVASEVMAIFCLATDLKDLKERLARIIVAYTYDGRPVTCGDLKAQGAMAALLRDAFLPNLVQTLEGTPAIIHGGPFANIAHGCNSVMATRTALSLADVVVTEAGFGADLGAEKFMDIKCRFASLTPGAVVLVATLRALKYHGGVPRDRLKEPDAEAVKKGFANLKRHYFNLKDVYGVQPVVALNRFETDTPEEISAFFAACGENAMPAAPCQVWEKGGEGGVAVARLVLDALKKPGSFRFCYEEGDTIEEKLLKITQRIYHGNRVVFAPAAKKRLETIHALGLDAFPVCVAKTQYSFSDDPALLGAPEGFDLNVRDLKIAAGAGFIVALTGDILTMPGLPKKPAAESIDVDENGVISGLF